LKTSLASAGEPNACTVITGNKKAGDVMNNDPQMREYLSAMADGELSGPEWLQALQFADRDEGKETWRMYHLVGDVLRSPDAAKVTDHGLAARVRQQLAQEAQALRPQFVAADKVPPIAQAAAANDAVFRWKLVAGVASVAAVASIAWNVWVDGPSGAQVLASQSASTAAVAQLAQNTSRAAPSVQGDTDRQVMIRDPRLDELLAARQQLVGTNALQLPAGFLRNATFERVQPGPAAR
jgi:sigma-E factor negative regulatory protein RseA